MTLAIDCAVILGLLVAGVVATWALLEGYISGVHWTWAMATAGAGLIGWGARM